MSQEVDSRGVVQCTAKRAITEDVGGRERVTTDEERSSTMWMLNIDQAVQSRLSNGESFVRNRKQFVFNAFIDFKPV